MGWLPHLAAAIRQMLSRFPIIAVMLDFLRRFSQGIFSGYFFRVFFQGTA